MSVSSDKSGKMSIRMLSDPGNGETIVVSSDFYGVETFGKLAHPPQIGKPQLWCRVFAAKTLNLFNIGEIRAEELVVTKCGKDGL